MTRPTDGYCLYESYPPSNRQNAFARIDKMAQAGFELLVNYQQNSGTLDDQIAYLDYASRCGMRVIYSLKDVALMTDNEIVVRYKDLVRGLGCKNRVSFIIELLKRIKQHPALWGTYVADEPQPSDRHEVLTYANLVKLAAPGLPRLFDTDVTYGERLDPYTNGFEVGCINFYPIGREDNWQVPHCRKTGIHALTEVAQNLQALCSANNKGMAMVLQAHSFGEKHFYESFYKELCDKTGNCRHPARREMAFMRREFEKFNPRLGLVFNFYTEHEIPQSWQNIVQVFGK